MFPFFCVQNYNLFVTFFQIEYIFCQEMIIFASVMGFMI